MTDEQLRALPYATLGVQVGAAAPSVMVLSRKESDLLYWVSADHVIFVTSYGRLVRTQGLKRDLVATDWKGVDPLAAAPGQSPDPDGLADIQRQLKIGVNHGETVWVSSSFQEVGDETLPSFNGTLTARRIIERVNVADWRWRTENMFWIADSGSVVKSRQQFCPEIPPISLELLKRPSNAA